MKSLILLLTLLLLPLQVYAVGFDFKVNKDNTANFKVVGNKLQGEFNMTCELFKDEGRRLGSRFSAKGEKVSGNFFMFEDAAHYATKGVQNHYQANVHHPLGGYYKFPAEMGVWYENCLSVQKNYTVAKKKREQELKEERKREKESARIGRELQLQAIENKKKKEKAYRASLPREFSFKSVKDTTLHIGDRFIYLSPDNSIGFYYNIEGCSESGQTIQYPISPMYTIDGVHKFKTVTICAGSGKGVVFPLGQIKLASYVRSVDYIKITSDDEPYGFVYYNTAKLKPTWTHNVKAIKLHNK